MSNEHSVSPRVVIIIFTVTLLGVGLGALLTMPHADPRPASKPTALGHQVRPAPATNAVTRTNPPPPAP